MLTDNLAERAAEMIRVVKTMEQRLADLRALTEGQGDAKEQAMIAGAISGAEGDLFALAVDVQNAVAALTAARQVIETLKAQADDQSAVAWFNFTEGVRVGRAAGENERAALQESIETLLGLMTDAERDELEARFRGAA